MRPCHPVILLIDDDHNDLLFLRAAFQAAGAGVRVQAVDSGDKALAYLNGEGRFADRVEFPFPDWILTDLNMPGMDGFAVLAFLKQKPECALLPTIVLSGSQDNDDVNRAYRLGASAYHVKPSSPLELRRLIKALCEYWSLCEAPETCSGDEPARSGGLHKLGERHALESMPVGSGGPP
jgi:CheY-like chemotaxis protein